MLAVVRALAERGRDVAGTGAEVVGAGVDDALRMLIDRRVERALRSTTSSVSAADVVDALAASSSSSRAHWLGQGGARLARRTPAVRFVGSRHPVGLALRFGPGLVDVISTNLRGLDVAVAHLVSRARSHRVDPDPDKLRAVVVQALVGRPIDPRAEVDHTSLVRLWMADAGRRFVPFGLGSVAGLVRGRTPEAVAAALAAVDVEHLRR